MAKIFKYILDFQAQTDKFGKDVGGMTGMLKGAAVAAGAFFAADKIMDAADAVADYAIEISKVRTEIGTITGAQGAALDVMTGQVKALADSYDQDVAETLKATNAIMREFGDTGTQAFDIMNAGFAASANSGGDFLAQVSEYATHFKEAGLSAEQMLAVIAEGNKMGVFDDKASDAIKEGSIRLREMTQSTQDALNAIGLSSTQIQADISSGNKSMFDVMQLVSKQLKTLPQQSPAVGAALADIFGGPGEDAVNFIRALGDMDLSLQGVIDNATRSQMEWTKELAEFHTVGAQVFGGTSNLLTEVKTTFLSMTNDAMKGLVDVTNYFIDLYNESIIFRGAIEYISLGFKQAWEAVRGALGLIWENLKATGKLIKAVFTLDAAGIAEAWKSGLTGVTEVVKEYGTNTAENFMDAWNNTMTPQKKIALISISEGDATTSGIAAGKSFASGITTGAINSLQGIEAQLKVLQTELSQVDSNDIDAIQAVGSKIVKLEKLKKAIESIASDPIEFRTDKFNTLDTKRLTQKQSVDYDGTVTYKNTVKVKSNEKDFNLKPKLNIDDFTGNTERLKKANQTIQDDLDATKERVEAAQGAFQSGFAQIGQSVVAGLGLAQTGLEGFVSGLASTVIELLSMFLAQSIGASIAGATASGAATGPAAIFTTPAFIATAIAGVLGAFAAIPAFAEGGIVSGPTLGLMGEYPGASSNPEVIAPLSKLKGLMGNSGGGSTIVLQPSIDFTGDRLRIMLNRVERNVRKRT